MALEKRDGNLYYYRSVREGEKVRKVYEGSGELARIVHEREIMDRALKEHKRQEEQAKLEELEALTAPVLEVGEAAELLTRAHLIASGYRRYQRHWRLRRARSS
jgi:hypothetical protein